VQRQSRQPPPVRSEPQPTLRHLTLLSLLLLLLLPLPLHLSLLLTFQFVSITIISSIVIIIPTFLVIETGIETVSETGIAVILILIIIIFIVIIIILLVNFAGVLSGGLFQRAQTVQQVERISQALRRRGVHPGQASNSLNQVEVAVVVMELVVVVGYGAQAPIGGV